MTSTVDRFLQKVDAGQSSDACAIWTAATIGQGRYGAFHFQGKAHRAHRFAYEMFVGPVPEGLVLDHLCKNTLCVNPAHLEPVTQRENTMRSDNFIAVNARKTHCSHGHLFDEANTRVYRGMRQCRECNRQAKARSRAAAS